MFLGRKKSVYAGVLLVIGLAAVTFALVYLPNNPSLHYLPSLGSAKWIEYPTPPNRTLRMAVELHTRFRRQFTQDSAPVRASLRIAAFKKLEASINGQRVVSGNDAPKNWKEPLRLDVTPYLRQGSNEISVDVYNDLGPPALWLMLESDEKIITSDDSWKASLAGAVEQKARPLSTHLNDWDMKRGDPLPRMGESLRLEWRTVASISGAWLIFFIIADVFRRRPGSAFIKEGTIFGLSPLAGALFLIVGLWGLLFWNNLSSLGRSDGFDPFGHLDYIKYILDHNRPPWPDEGWSMFHPPLYYALSTVVLRLAGHSDLGEKALDVLRMQGFVLGIAQVVLIAACLRLLFPGRRSVQFIGIVLAAFLPMNLYIYQYVNNETLVTTLMAASLYLALRILGTRKASTWLYAGLGVCLGAAMLSKFSALLIVAAVLGVLAGRLLLQRQAATEWVRTIGVTCLACLAVCGWRFAGVWLRLGSPFVGGWDPLVGAMWWMDPGYHEASYYLQFGHVFDVPYFSGLWSIWDGLYSTLWGDGMIGGQAYYWAAPPWNYELMTVGYLLAIVPTLGVFLGAGVAIRRLMGKPEAPWVLLVGVAASFAAISVYMSFVVPSFAQVKAFYAMGALVPFCAFGGRGLASLLSRGVVLRMILMVTLASWASTAYASFWIPRDTAESHARLGIITAKMEGPASPAAKRHLTAALEKDPRNAVARLGMALLRQSQGRSNEAISELRRLLRDHPDHAVGYTMLATYLSGLGFTDEAMQHAQRATELAPDYPLGWYTVGIIEKQTGKPLDAIRALRRTLSITPDFAPAHLHLADVMRAEGRIEEASLHEKLARKIIAQTRKSHHIPVGN